MEGPRAPTEREFSQVVAFLNSNLRPESNWSIVSEYPTALAPNNIGNIRIITENNKVLSHAVLKPLILKSPSTVLKAAAIGSVVTDGANRGQGLSRQILTDCLREAARQECDIAVLWTNLYDFYRKLNFELAGCENSVLLQENFTVNPHNLRFLKGNSVAAESIHRLYMQHTVGSLRTVDEIRKFLQIPNTTLYTAWEPGGQLAAYAVEGKGADLQGYIHEWGGAVSKLMALLSWIREQKNTPMTVIMGSQSTNLLGALQSVPGAQYNEGYLGMIKLVNKVSLFQKVHRAARNIGISDLVLEEFADGFRFGTTTDAIEFPDEKDLTKILFGPLPDLPILRAETIQKIERLFPLNLWIWGWDSI